MDKTIKDKLLKLITKNKFNEVCEEILKLYPNENHDISNLIKSTILLQSQIQRLKMDDLSDSFSSENLNLRRNKIGKNLIELIDEIYKNGNKFNSTNNLKEEKLGDKIADYIALNDFEGIYKFQLSETTKLENDIYINSILSYNTKPLSKYIYIKAAYNSFANRNYEESVKRFNHALNLGFPREKQIISKIGACLTRLKKFDKAENALNEAISVYPDYPLSYYNKGILMKEQQRYEDAKTNFTLAINKLKNLNSKVFILANINLATTLVDIYKDNVTNAKPLDTSIEILQNIIVVDEDRNKLKGLISYNLACIYSIKEVLDKAISCLEYSLTSYPKNVEDIDNEDDLFNLKTQRKDEFTKIKYQALKKI